MIELGADGSFDAAAAPATSASTSKVSAPKASNAMPVEGEAGSVQAAMDAAEQDTEELAAKEAEEDKEPARKL